MLTRESFTTMFRRTGIVLEYFEHWKVALYLGIRNLSFHKQCNYNKDLRKNDYGTRIKNRSEAHILSKNATSSEAHVLSNNATLCDRSALLDFMTLNIVWKRLKALILKTPNFQFEFLVSIAYMYIFTLSLFTIVGPLR